MKRKLEGWYERKASEADDAYQLAREQQVIELYERRQREIDAILGGQRPAPPRLIWVIIALWALSLGGASWALVRLLLS